MFNKEKLNRLEQKLWDLQIENSQLRSGIDVLQRVLINTGLLEKMDKNPTEHWVVFSGQKYKIKKVK